MANSIFIYPGPIQLINGGVLTPDGSASAPAYSFSNEPNSGFYRNATNQIAVDIAGSARVVFTGTGITIPLNNGAILFGASSDTTLTRTAAAVLTCNGVLVATLFQTSTALITATGASTAAFLANGVGGAGGPTTAAQNGWVKANDSTGALIWIPVWK